MRVCQNSQGFTLIEAMIALAVFAAVASLFPLWIHVMDHHEKTENLDPMEVALFFQQAGLEIREAASLNQNGGKLLLQKYNGDTVSYGLKNSVIRRQVNGRGSVWMLQHVKDVRFKLLGTTVVITVTGPKGDTYVRIFFPFEPKT